MAGARAANKSWAETAARAVRPATVSVTAFEFLRRPRVAAKMTARPVLRTTSSTIASPMLSSIFHVGFRNVLTDALSMRVGPIDIKDEALAVASGFRVRPRVRRALQPALSVGGGEGGSIASGPGGDRRVTLKSANPTLREVLDMLAVSAGEVIWVVTYPPHGLSEGRWQLTVTMGGHPVSPQHQPHWEFLPWGPPSLVKVSGMKPGPIRR